jgi:hypothetical protein
MVTRRRIIYLITAFEAKFSTYATVLQTHKSQDPPVLHTTPASGSAGNPALLFKLIQVGVGGGITQDPAHRNDLAFVMKGVGQDVMKDERRRADRGVSIREMQFYPSIQVLLAEV